MNSRNYCAMLSQDVRGTFNFANWSQIKGALAESGVPGYLASLIDNYLAKKTVWHRDNKGPCKYVISLWVSQGPLLFNAIHMLVYSVTEEATYAGDLPVVATAKYLEDVVVYATIRLLS